MSTFPPTPAPPWAWSSSATHRPSKFNRSACKDSSRSHLTATAPAGWVLPSLVLGRQTLKRTADMITLFRLLGRNSVGTQQYVLEYLCILRIPRRLVGVKRTPGTDDERRATCFRSSRSSTATTQTALAY